MIEQIDYFEQDGEAVICRVYGTGSYADLPGRVNGLPVTALYDHCFAPSPSNHLKDKAILTWHGSGAGEMRDPAPLCGSMLEEICLPDGLQSIGDYAFYDCYHLKKLTIPASLRQLGRGVFVAANHLEILHFGADAQKLTPVCMRDILSEITYEVEAVIEDAAGGDALRLFFPEYYERSIENTPARLINMAFEGTGFRYRQCFKDGQLDLPRYDALFHTASVQEYLAAVMRLALERLRTPVDLSVQAKADYLEFLRENEKMTADYVLRDEREELLAVLMDAGYFNAELVERWLRRAAERKRSEAASWLMELSRKWQAAQKNSARPSGGHKYEW